MEHPHRPRVALVLGAGGITSIAWHMGALEALRDATGWDPAQADVLCGTSAGAVAAAVTAARVPAEALLEMAEDPAVLERETALATGARRRGPRVPLPPTAAAPVLAMAALTARDPRRRVAALAGLVPLGLRSGDEVRGLVRRATVRGWPASGPRLLVPAVDCHTGERVVFGTEEAPEATLADAVTASAAVPGLYRPVRIGQRRYVDGGVWSCSNADVVAPYAPHVVVCLSPLATTATGGRRDAALLGPVRRATAWQLRGELAGLRRAGAQAAVLEPTRADLAVMGLDVMRRSHSRRVVEQARTSVGARLAAGHPVADALAQVVRAPRLPDVVAAA